MAVNLGAGVRKPPRGLEPEARDSKNIRNATFEQKVRVIDILNVKVYPSENLDQGSKFRWRTKGGSLRVITPASRRQSCRSGSQALLPPHRLEG